MKQSIMLFLSVVLIYLFPITTYAAVETDAGVTFSNSYAPPTNTEETQLMPHEETSKDSIQISSNAKYPNTGSVANNGLLTTLGILCLWIFLLLLLKIRRKKTYE